MSSDYVRYCKQGSSSSLHVSRKKYSLPRSPHVQCKGYYQLWQSSVSYAPGSSTTGNKDSLYSLLADTHTVHIQCTSGNRLVKAPESAFGGNKMKF